MSDQKIFTILGMGAVFIIGVVILGYGMIQVQEHEELNEYCVNLGYDGRSQHFYQDGKDMIMLKGFIEINGIKHISCYDQSIINGSIVTELDLIELKLMR